jgi:hypothetical protein
MFKFQFIFSEDQTAFLMHVSEILKLAEIAEKDKETRIKERNQNLIAQMLGSTTGREKLAQSMAQPLRRNLDMSSIARQVFRVESLPEGALPVYERDVTI